jgi:acyl-CoA synthetase (NDP forming)
LSLARLFAPRSIALVGIPGDLSRPGARPLHFLRRHGYDRGIHLVNPRHREIGGLPAYPSIGAVPEAVDVAWISLPAAQAAGAVAEAGRAGVPFAVVIGAGFAEAGEAGQREQARLREAARGAGVRFVGPNTEGLVNAWDGVALTFSTVGEVEALRPGPMVILSQSGGVGGCLLNRAIDRRWGVGLFVSTGNEADLTLADYIEWLVDDGRVGAIACIVEQVRDPQRLLGAARRAGAGGIPVVALKLGRSEAGARAARSHTGALVGTDEAWRAWAQAAGILQADGLEQLLEAAAYLSATPPLQGNRTAIVTSSGGMAVMLADALEPRGFTFAPFAAETAGRIAALLPPYATVRNPLDITAGLPEETFGEVLAAVTHDPGIDQVVVPLTMATAGGGGARAGQIIAASRGAEKPLAVCWPDGSLVRRGFQALDEAHVPLFHSVGDCAAVLGLSLEYRAVRQRGAPAEPDPPRMRLTPPSQGGALPWADVRPLLLAAGIMPAPEVIVRSEAEARTASAGLRYPVAVKVLGPLHKSEAGGVRLGLGDAEAVLRAVRELAPRGEGCLIQPMFEGVEVLVGALRDPALGPFVVVAPGGVAAELYGERATRPAPVSRGQAEAMIAECRSLSALLAGYRGRPPADRQALAETIARASALAAALESALVELDLNPVMVGPEGAGAHVVDARIILTGR